MKHAKTTSGGESKTLENSSSALSSLPAIVGPFRTGVDALEMPIQLVQALNPHLAMLFDPVSNAVQSSTLQMTGPELGVPGPADQAAVLQDL